MRRHLPPAGPRILSRADRPEQHLVRGRPQSQAEPAVAVIRVKPVVGGLEGQSSGDAERFVAGAGDLKVDFLLPLEQDFAVIHPARHVHEAVGVDELLGRQTFVRLFLDSRLRPSRCPDRCPDRRHEFGLSLRNGHSTSPLEPL